MEPLKQRPPALPTLAEWRARAACRRRRRKAGREAVEPATWPPPGLTLPSDEELEAAGRVVALPMAGRLVPVLLNTKPVEAAGEQSPRLR